MNGRQGLALLLNLSVPASKGTDKFERKSAERQAYGKYKKKKIPTSRLRDLLLILCQILAIACCAMLLATPSQVLRQQPEEGEVIVIVDASASMRATTDDETRFIRAVRQASELSDKIL